MDWIPVITTTTVLGVIAWLGRNLIITRLTNSVMHEYDRKLETLKSELHKTEEKFKAELNSKESQMESLRNVILSNITRRQDIIFERQVAAIESLWATVISLAPGKGLSTTLAPMKFESAAKEAAKNPEFRQMFLIIGKDVDPKTLKTDEALKVRPFVSVLVWAYFSAYQAIVFNAVLKLHMLKAGIDNVDIIDSDKVNNLVKTALPHQAEYIEKWGDAAFHFLLDELESKLIIAFQMMLEGKELDEETMKKATLIIKESEAVLGSEEAGK